MSSFSASLPQATSTSPLLSRPSNSYRTIAPLEASEPVETDNNDNSDGSTEGTAVDDMSIQSIYSNIRHAVTGTTGQQEYAALPQNPLPHKRDDSSRPGSISSDDTEKSSEDGGIFCSPRRWISPRVISDATIGLSDGLTVPFALTAGLSALGDTRVVIYGGMAELFAGAISMGLGGYLGARSECQAHGAALSDTQRTVRDKPTEATWQVRSALAQYGLSDSTMKSVIGELSESPDCMEKFIMRFHHEQSDSAASALHAYISGLTIALGYFFGGLLPLLPYLFCESISAGFWWSCGVMTNILFIFGCVKTWLIENESAAKCIWNGVQMVVLGGLAAGAAMGCVAVIGDT